MKYLSQRDPRWANKKLGASSLTLGRFGCTTTSLSMLTDYFGKYWSPPEIAGTKAFYTTSGLVQWEKLKLPMKFVSRIRTRNDSAIQASIKDPDKAVLLNVNNGAHWVVALRKAVIGDDYLVVDPWTGTTCWAIKTYHSIDGSAHFNRN